MQNISGRPTRICFHLLYWDTELISAALFSVTHTIYVHSSRPILKAQQTTLMVKHKVQVTPHPRWCTFSNPPDWYKRPARPPGLLLIHTKRRTGAFTKKEPAAWAMLLLLAHPLHKNGASVYSPKLKQPRNHHSFILHTNAAAFENSQRGMLFIRHFPPAFYFGEAPAAARNKTKGWFRFYFRQRSNYEQLIQG